MKKSSMWVASVAMVSVVWGQTPLSSPGKKMDTHSTNVKSRAGLLVQEVDQLPVDDVVQLTQEAFPDIYQLFRDQIAEKQTVASSSVVKTSSLDMSNPLHTVWTKRGVLSILDRSDGVVHLFVHTGDMENPSSEAIGGLALSTVITQDGIEVLSMDQDGLARFLGMDESGAVGGSNAQAADIARVDSAKDLLAQEVEQLPDGVTVQLTEDVSPGMYQVFRNKIAEKQADVFPAVTASSLGTNNPLHTVWTKRGSLTILDRGDGIVHLFIHTADVENPSSEAIGGLALYAVITKDGVDVLSMNQD